MWKVLVPHLAFCHKLFLNISEFLLFRYRGNGSEKTSDFLSVSFYFQNYLHYPIHVQIVER